MGIFRLENALESGPRGAFAAQPLMHGSLETGVVPVQMERVR